MGFFTGNISDKRTRLKELMQEKNFEVKERELEDEMQRVTSQIYQTQQRVRQLEDQLEKLTQDLGNPQNQPRWQQLEQEKLKIEQEIDRLANIESREAREFLLELERFRALVISEERVSRKAA